jgi:thymidylate synthase (FAD)
MRYYVPPKIDYYIPAFENIRRQTGKPGAYSFEEIEDPDLKSLVMRRMQEVIGYSDLVYRDLIELGVAKEIARCVLPVSQYTEFIWTVNVRSLINFISFISISKLFISLLILSFSAIKKIEASCDRIIEFFISSI